MTTPIARPRRPRPPGLWLLLAVMLAASPLTAAAQRPCGEIYTVVAGDTLTRIADRCDTTVQAIIEVNPDIDDPNAIRVGQQLTMPVPAPPTGVPQEHQDYVVQPGETLSRLAARFGTTVSAIVAANPDLTDPNRLRVGQRLRLPRPEVGAPYVAISPLSGPAGTGVRVAASGFAPDTAVETAVAMWRSDYTEADPGTTDEFGRLDTEATIPDAAQVGQRWVVTVTVTEDNGRRDPSLRATSAVFTVSEEEQDPGLFDLVEIHLVAVGQGDVGCNDAIVPVLRNVTPTRAPLTAAISELLAMRERTYGDSGLTNVFGRSEEVRLQEAAVEAGVARLHLTGPLPIIGVCDHPRVTEQLHRTALQFDTVEDVEVYVDGERLQDVLDLR